MLQVRHPPAGGSNFYRSTQKYSSFEAIQCCGDSSKRSVAAIWWHVRPIFKIAAVSSKAMTALVVLHFLLGSSMAAKFVKMTIPHRKHADKIKFQLGRVAVTSCAKDDH